MSHAASRGKQAEPGHDVFISYWRNDQEFVCRLDTALKARSRETWVDWERTPPTEGFMGVIYGAILMDLERLQALARIPVFNSGPYPWSAAD